MGLVLALVVATVLAVPAWADVGDLDTNLGLRANIDEPVSAGMATLPA